MTGARAASETKGAIMLFLPPQSPDFNPIEQVFERLTSTLRKAHAPTVHALEAPIATALNALSPDRCTAYSKNSAHETEGAELGFSDPGDKHANYGVWQDA
ncbi:MAG: transposase [Pseudomonadota bacterium]